MKRGTEWDLGGAVLPPQKIIGFVILKWHILLNSEVLNLKYVIILGDILIDVPPTKILGVDASTLAGFRVVRSLSNSWASCIIYTVCLSIERQRESLPGMG